MNTKEMSEWTIKAEELKEKQIEVVYNLYLNYNVGMKNLLKSLTYLTLKKLEGTLKTKIKEDLNL